MATFNLKPKPWTGDGSPLADSNMALVGSELDKIARKGAASKEAAWTGAGAAPGANAARHIRVAPTPRTTRLTRLTITRIVGAAERADGAARGESITQRIERSLVGSKVAASPRLPAGNFGRTAEPPATASRGPTF